MSTLPTHSRQTLIWRKKVVAVHTAVQMKLHIVEDGPWQVPHSSGQTCHEDWTRSFKIARPILLFALKLGFKVNWCWGINSWELGTVSGCRLFSLEAMSFAHQYAELLKFVSPELLPRIGCATKNCAKHNLQQCVLCEKRFVQQHAEERKTPKEHAQTSSITRR